MNNFEALTAALLEFRDARDWRQFHSLRNLITSLNLEAAELLELTQWKSDAEIEALPAEMPEHSIFWVTRSSPLGQGAERFCRLLIDAGG